jgi:mannosyltransferase
MFPMRLSLPSFARVPLLWLWCAVLLALVVRLWALDARSLWYDEAFAVLFAEKGLDAMLYGTLTPVDGGAADIHPLLYYTTLNGWMAVFGQSAFAVRLWSVVTGVLTVPLVYIVARRLFDAPTAAGAALVLALAPFHVQYAQETRMYSLLGLLLAAATYCYIRMIVQPPPTARARVLWTAAFGVLAAAAMYTQQLAAFYLMALGLAPLVTGYARRMGWMVGGAAWALLIYAPWLVNIPSQLAKVGAYYWIEHPSLARVLLTLRSYLTINADLPPLLNLAALGLTLLVLCLLVLQIVRYLRRRSATPEQKAALVLVLWLFAAPIALLWLVSQVQAVYLDRGLLPSGVMLYVALGWLLARGGLPRPFALLVGAILVGLCGTSLWTHYTWQTFPYSPHQQATESIAAQWQGGDVIIHQNKLSALPMRFYGRALDQSYLNDVPGSSNDTLALPTQQALAWLGDDCLATAVIGDDGQQAARVWFVVFARSEAQYRAAGLPDLDDQRAWLDTYYTRQTTLTFNDLLVYQYAAARPLVAQGCP